MERILPPINGIFPRETSAFGAVKGRKPPSSIPHRGVDFNYAVGQSGVNLIHPEVYAPVSGIVTRVGGRYGLIAIRDANGLSHEILHTSSQKVKVGQKVFAGIDKIGTMGNTGVSDHHVHYQLIDRAANRMDPASFWNQQSYYPREYQQYLNISGNNSSNELDSTAVAQVASGSPRNSEPPFPFPPTNDLSRQSLIDRRFGKWASPPNDPGNGQSRASVFDTGAGAVRYLSRIVPSDRQDAIDDRFGNWTATAAGTTPRNPNQPAPSPEPGRPPGIVTGQPTPLWITPPPIFDSPDRSAASRSNSDQFPSRSDGVRSSNTPRASVFDTRAPAVPFVAPYERFTSGSLNGSSVPLSADDVANTPNAPIGHSGLQSVNNDDELSWLIQLLSRRQQ